MKYQQPMMDEPSIWDTSKTWEQWLDLVRATDMPPDQKSALIEMAELVLRQKQAGHFQPETNPREMQ